MKKEENRLQVLLRVVEDNRLKYRDANKKAQFKEYIKSGWACG